MGNFPFRYTLSMASAQLYLFTGENSEELLREKARWTHEFVSKHGESDLLIVPASTLDKRDLLDAVGTAPFLSERRLVIVEGIPRWTAEEMEMIASSLHQQCVLVFVEPSPDGRLVGVKALQKLATVKNFEPKTGKALRVFLLEEAKKIGGAFEPAALEKLIVIVGEDQGMLAQEVRKLCMYAQGRNVTEADVALLAVPAGEHEIWELSRMLAEGKANSALAYTRMLIARGEDPHSIWNILLWITRQFVSVWSAAQEGITNPGDITSRLKVPFPSVRTLLPAAGRSSKAQVTALLERSVQDDIALKKGGYRSTAESPEEILALLDLLVMRMSAAMSKNA